MLELVRQRLTDESNEEAKRACALLEESGFEDASLFLNYAMCLITDCGNPLMSVVESVILERCTVEANVVAIKAVDFLEECGLEDAALFLSYGMMILCVKKVND